MAENENPVTSVRKSYEPPVLELLGPVRSLTLGATGSAVDVVTLVAPNMP